MTYDPRTVIKPELDQKANASTVGGLARALDSKAANNEIEALFANLPTYETDADAGAAGLRPGQPYRTAAGQVMVKL